MKSAEMFHGYYSVCEDFTTSTEANPMGCGSVGAGMSGLSTISG
jgi:hypothetical protein